jgi:Flp pilus assembly pilin Flp
MPEPKGTIIMNNTIKPVSPSRSTRSIRKLAKDTRGAGLVEYIILVGVVALGGMTAFGAFSKEVNAKIQGMGNTVKTIPGGSAAAQ